MRTLLTGLREWQWLGALIARLAVGLLFFLSGRGKLFVPQRREQMRESLVAAGIPFASINAIFVSTVEFVFGLLVILGALTPLACIMLGGVMVVAIVTLRDQKYQNTATTRLALRILIPSRSTLFGNSFLAFSFRPWLAQRRPFRLRSALAVPN